MGSSKVISKVAIDTFDYIHSLDTETDVLSKFEKEKNKHLKYFIQVNVGQEIQKSGIPVRELDPFFDYCTKEKN